MISGLRLGLSLSVCVCLSVSVSVSVSVCLCLPQCSRFCLFHRLDPLSQLYGRSLFWYGVGGIVPGLSSLSGLNIDTDTGFGRRQQLLFASCLHPMTNYQSESKKHYSSRSMLNRGVTGELVNRASFDSRDFA